MNKEIEIYNTWIKDKEDLTQANVLNCINDALSEAKNLRQPVVNFNEALRVAVLPTEKEQATARIKWIAE